MSPKLGDLGELAKQILDDGLAFEGDLPQPGCDTWWPGIEKACQVLLAFDAWRQREVVEDGTYQALCSRVISELAKLDLAELNRAKEEVVKYEEKHNYRMIECEYCFSQIPAWLGSCPYCLQDGTITPEQLNSYPS